MHEKSTPLVLPETTQGSLADVPRRWASAEPGRVAFSVRSGAGWTDVTSATFAADVAALAKGLIAAGIGVGDERLTIAWAPAGLCFRVSSKKATVERAEMS